MFQSTLHLLIGNAITFYTDEIRSYHYNVIIYADETMVTCLRRNIHIMGSGLIIDYCLISLNLPQHPPKKATKCERWCESVDC